MTKTKLQIKKEKKELREEIPSLEEDYRNLNRTLTN